MFVPGDTRGLVVFSKQRVRMCPHWRVLTVGARGSIMLRLGRVVFIANSRTNVPDVHAPLDCAGSRKMRAPVWLAQPSRDFRRLRSLSLLAQPSRHFVRVGLLSLWRGAAFSWFSEILPKQILWIIWQALLWRSWKIFLVQSSGPIIYEEFDHGLVEVVVGSGILQEVLASSCTCPYEKILWRSCWHPLRGPCMVLHKSLW